MTAPTPKDAPESPKNGALWVTTAAAADVFGVSERTVKRWIDAGEIESQKQGRRRFVRPFKVTSKVTFEVTSKGHESDIKSDTGSATAPDLSVIEGTSKVTPEVTQVTSEVTRPDAMVEQLRSEVARLAGHVERLDGHVERLTMLVESANQSLQREQQLHAETLLQLSAKNNRADSGTVLSASPSTLAEPETSTRNAQKATPTPFVADTRDAPISDYGDLADWLEKEILGR
jgi:excisionase family DNA binding protein